MELRDSSRAWHGIFRSSKYFKYILNKFTFAEFFVVRSPNTYSECLEISNLSNLETIYSSRFGGAKHFIDGGRKRCKNWRFWPNAIAGESRRTLRNERPEEGPIRLVRPRVPEISDVFASKRRLDVRRHFVGNVHVWRRALVWLQCPGCNFF